MENYEKKLRYLVYHQNFKCLVCGKTISNGEKIDLHHLLPNAYRNQRQYPRFINSLMNLVALHHNCHIARGNTLKNSYRYADTANIFLRNHPEISKFVNGEK